MSTDRIVFEDKNEQFGFTQLPNVVLTSTVLNPTEKCIYGILRRYATMSKGAMPSIPTICLEANISKKTYQRAVKRFVKAKSNPKPDVPLITAIHREGMSSIFKIHRITDRLVAKLKPAVAFSKDEKKKVKSQPKRKKKAVVQKNKLFYQGQNDPTYQGQNDPTYQGQNDPTYQGQNDPLVILNTSNIEVSNIEQQHEEPPKKDVVVTATNSILICEKWEELFNESLSVKKIEKIVDKAKQGMATKQIAIHNPTEQQVVERILYVMEQMKIHSYPFDTNAWNAITNALENGYTWKKAVKQRKSNTQTENIPAALSHIDQAQKEAGATVTVSDDWSTINQQLAAWEELKKKRSGIKQSS